MCAAQTTAAVQLRPLEPSDSEAWLALWRGYLEFYEKSSLSDEVTQTTWRRLLDQDGPADLHGLTAVDQDGRLVGFVHYIFHHATWSIEKRCYLEDLFVDPESRGRGVGRQLIEAVYAAASARGVNTVYWHTNADNQRARRLYDNVGVLTNFIKYENPKPTPTKPA